MAGDNIGLHTDLYSETHAASIAKTQNPRLPRKVGNT